jgi:hypothetical protein
MGVDFHSSRDRVGVVIFTAAAAAVLVLIISGQKQRQPDRQSQARSEGNDKGARGAAGSPAAPPAGGKSRKARAQQKASHRARDNEASSLAEPAPKTERALPAVLRTGNGPIKVPRVSTGERQDVDLVAQMAEALATELFGLESAEGGSVVQALEAYSIPKDIKRTINYNSKDKKGTIHHRIKECTRFCELYETFIRHVIAPHMLREFVRESESARGVGAGGVTGVTHGASGHAADCGASEFSALAKSDRTVLFQFPPTIRIYCSHIGRADSQPARERRTTPAVGEMGMGAEERQRAIEDEQREYRSLGKIHTDAGESHALEAPLTRVRWKRP